MIAVCGIAAVILMAARESSEPAGDVPSQTVAPQPKTPGMTIVRAKTLAAGVTEGNNPPAAPMTPSVTTAAPVTLAGCLERADETFRLRDTLGPDAPKSRSWKSGFLKKSSTSIKLVDAPNRLNLTNHVGQRVSVTGTLEDGQMRVRSMRRVAASCK
jgi:hypothetical protein